MTFFIINTLLELLGLINLIIMSAEKLKICLLQEAEGEQESSSLKGTIMMATHCIQSRQSLSHRWSALST